MRRIFGVGLILFGVAGLFLPFIPGIALIILGILLLAGKSKKKKK
jgi:uncharacterized protein YqgC (DUF456 family)